MLNNHSGNVHVLVWILKVHECISLWLKKSKVYRYYMYYQHSICWFNVISGTAS